MDEYDPGFYASSPKKNPVAGGLISFVNNNFTNAKTVRVLRGGLWYNDPNILRVANRGCLEPAFMFFDYGFRCTVRSEEISDNGEI